MNKTLTAEEQRELTAVYFKLTEIARRSNSIISSVDLGAMHQRGDLPLLKFIHKFWSGTQDSSLFAVKTAYAAAEQLGKVPMEFLTEEQVMMVCRVWNTCLQGAPIQVRSEENVIPFITLFLSHPQHEDFIKSLISDRGIHDVGRLRVMVEEASETSLPLIDGTL